MDYSTISNRTSTEQEEITHAELNERYYSLKKQYDNLSSNYEATKQELYDARRNYQTALDVQRHLSCELENHQADEERRRSELNSRIVSLQAEIATLRDERSETAEHHASEILKFESEIRRLKEEKVVSVVSESPEKKSVELEEARAALSSALSDITAVKSELDEARREILSWRLKAEELVNEMGEMRIAADLRREELKAASEREAAALADLAEARAKLHHCNDAQDLQSHAAKGNSIFAEVEDKRQEMAKTLIQMKQSNAKLKRDLASKQAELDALLHEKQTIWEQQVGASAHYDRELIESYEDRITQLEGLCERRRREMAKWFGKQCEPTAQGWLPGVLDHLKSECEQLRAEVLSRGAAQLASAAQVRELRRKIALLTANGVKKSDTSAVGIDPNALEDTDDTHLPKIAMQTKPKPTADDVKKKVSFN